MKTEDAKDHCYKLADHLRDLDSDSRDAVAIETLLGALMPQKTLREMVIDIFHYAMTSSLNGIEGTTAFYTAGKFRDGIAAGIDALIRDGFLTMSISAAQLTKPTENVTCENLSNVEEAIFAAKYCCAYYDDELRHIEKNNCSVSPYAPRMTYAHLETLIAAVQQPRAEVVTVEEFINHVCRRFTNPSYRTETVMSGVRLFAIAIAEDYPSGLIIKPDAESGE